MNPATFNTLSFLASVDRTHVAVIVFGTFLLLTGLATAFKATTRLQAFSRDEGWLDRFLRRGSACILFLVGLGLASGGVWLQVQIVLYS